MKLLLDDRFAPITSSVGFYEAPLQAVAHAVYEWRRSLAHRVVSMPVRETFPEMLHRLEPLTVGEKRRELLLSTDSSWTAYFDNLATGTDPVGPISHLSRALKCRGLVVTCVPNVKSPKGMMLRYGAVTFELFGPEQTEWLNVVRSIVAGNDGGRWVFYTSGEVQPFEQPERYQARRIADRFTAEMLEEYCAALSIRYFDPEFYGPDGVLVEVQDRLPGHLEAIGLAEAQRRYGVRA